MVLLADDLGRGAIGFTGGITSTPSIDSIAREGAAFDQFYVQPLCTPTRAALLTGRYPSRLGLGNRNARGPSAEGLPPEAVTLAEVLREHGYRTAITGKWHLGNPAASRPAAQGFSRQYGSYANIEYLTHSNGGRKDWYRDGEALEETGHVTDLVAREAIDLIRDHPPEIPLFLYVPFHAAHAAREEPAEWLAKFEELEPRERLLQACVAHLDAAVGAILAELERSGMADDTIVVFLTDNGTQYTSGGLRGEKSKPYEAAIRVPAAIRWPERVSAGRSVSGVAHVVDLFPTLLAAAGIDFDEDSIDGRSILPLLDDETAPTRELLLYVGRKQGALRSGRFKLIVDWEGDGVELFDIESDPFEERNLAVEFPDKVSAMKERLDVLSQVKENG